MPENMSREEVVIQHLVMPSGIVDGEVSLYNRNSDTRRFPLALMRGDRLDLRSHFNLLPIGKLRENADTGRIFLRLRFEGSLTVHLTVCGQGVEKTSVLVPADGEPCAIDCPEGDLLGVVVEATEDSVLHSGEFLCRPESSNDVHLAHIICTYRREDELRRKLELIEGFLDDNPETEGRLEIIVVDNGGTIEDIPERNVHLVKSSNYGGSAGFSRGMLEAREGGKATHVLLNDDDARLDPEVIFRTISFYSLLRRDLSDTMLGGTMLLLDDPCVSNESGAIFDGLGVHSLKRRLDLSDLGRNVELERRTDIDYFGWWYLAMPMESVEKYGYPLPMFYKIDDVEYGLRSASRKVTMCGISVWHPSFSANYSASGTYYARRNTLVLLACRRLLDKGAVRDFFEKALLETACLRYISADAAASATEDFLKGPEEVFRMHLGGAKKVTGYDYGNMQELAKNIRPRTVKTAGFKFRKYTMNGLLLPSAGDIVTNFGNMQTEDFYRVGKALYTPDGKKGTVCRRKTGRAIAQTLGFLMLERKMMRRIEKMNEEYGDAAAYYSSEEYWKDVFRDRRLTC